MSMVIQFKEGATHTGRMGRMKIEISTNQQLDTNVDKLLGLGEEWDIM